LIAQECAGRSAEPQSGPWISDRVLCRFSFLTLRGPNQHGAVRRASGQPTQRPGAPDVRHIIFGEAFRPDTDTARLPRRLLDREALATRAIPDKIDHALNWRGMQRIRIGRSLSETKRWPHTRICGNLAKHGLEFGKQLLDRIEVIWRRVDRCRMPGRLHEGWRSL
jgi:hypothetical protein